ncbi:MAG: preprotein translocase subunit SecG [Alphaproteobacteria bacterium]|nr:preprotein translocase subunit SecG [Alphaproteobacteria bacterium]MBN2779834.1 preprotein translocase subunit SecG [Alphaproteobacteria bacterium]
MLTILLVVHVAIGLALIGITLIQKSEGGVLGIGGGAKMGGLMTGAGAGNFLTKMTTYLAIAFFALSMTLSMMVYIQNTAKAKESLIKEEATQTQQTKIPEQPTVPTK